MGMQKINLCVELMSVSSVHMRLTGTTPQSRPAQQSSS